MHKLKKPVSASVFAVLTGSIILAIAGVAIAQDAVSNTPEQEKQAILERLAATRSAAIQFASEHPDQLPPANPTTMPTVEPTSWSFGIIDGQPFGGGGFGLRNMWSWDLGGNHVQVFAGRMGPNTSEVGRGVLLVHVTSMDLQPVSELSGSYKAPVGVGALRIMSFEGTRLTVEAETGETFYFDAETRDFTDSNGDPVPTDTPTPTAGPDSSPVASLTFPQDTGVPDSPSAVPVPSADSP